MAALLVALLCGASPTVAPDTAVVCPTLFREALEPWLEYRRGQGHEIVVLSAEGTAEQIRQRVIDTAKGGKLRFLLIVGDCEPIMWHDPGVRKRCVPAHYFRAEVTPLWGSEPTIAGDHAYANLDDDPQPELAVGRLPVDTPGQLRTIVEKIVHYEQNAPMGPWRRRLNLVASTGGFGLLADRVLESATRYLLTEAVPPGYRVSMTYGSWQSPYCPDPRLFRSAILDRLNEGSLFWVYVGHGMHLSLKPVEVPGGMFPSLDVRDMPYLDCRQGAPVALFLCCYAGAFDASQDCLAERMLYQPGGPVAAVAGSRMTMPYAMAVLSSELIDECFQRHAPTLGEAVLRAKQRTLQAAEQASQRRVMFDTVARTISPQPDKLAEERLEHIWMFNLLGDPLLRLKYPRPIDLHLVPRVAAGRRLLVAANVEIDGHATVELVPPRDRLGFKPPRRSQFPTDAKSLAEFSEVYRRANNRQLSTAEGEVVDGRLRVILDVPAELHGKHLVRVYVEGHGDFALGAADVEVDPSSRPVPVAARSSGSSHTQ